MAFEIRATGRAVPPRRVTNQDLADRVDTTDEWIKSHTGIGARHIADEGIACSDLAFQAAEAALSQLAETNGESAAMLAADLDLIILATTSADYIGVPSTACVLQDKLGARNAAAFDITACCTGLVYALEIAAGLLAMNVHRKRALVIGSELLSRITDWSDRGSCVLFGDGAAAIILEKTDAPREGAGRRGLIQSILHADGSGAQALFVQGGGTRDPFKAGEVLTKQPHLIMDGRIVYNFAVKALTSTIEELLQADGITIDAVRWIIPHQANARIVNAAQKRLGISDDKLYLNIEEYANTSAASIGIALDELNRAHRIAQGDLVMLVGFGAGLTYGGSLIVW
ncbi:MAG: ketoacyl-ACP synthase III [Spirochaetaceae bacterium]|jgi:3-oxoacyl-[acyl-carrier-protein] synthase-3|nr:ketoacyl-ACP synthase III [Spirochaetaceae bacterium]